MITFNMADRKHRAALLALCAFLAWPVGIEAKKQSAAQPSAKATPPEEALRAYIARVRAQQATEVRTPGSIWSPNG
jgi:flagellar L-ring protein FlgH